MGDHQFHVQHHKKQRTQSHQWPGPLSTDRVRLRARSLRKPDHHCPGHCLPSNAPWDMASGAGAQDFASLTEAPRDSETEILESQMFACGRTWRRFGSVGSQMATLDFVLRAVGSHGRPLGRGGPV